MGGERTEARGLTHPSGSEGTVICVGRVRGHPAEGLGWQSNLGRCASAVGPDVGVADVLATGAFGPGLPQSTPTRRTSGPGLAPGSCPAENPTQPLILSR